MTSRLLIALVALLSGPLAAQSVTERDRADSQLLRESACGTCQIIVRTIASIDDSIFNVNFGAPRVFRGTDGSFIVAGSDGTLGVFNARGSYLRKVGRAGDGPGEFRFPMHLHNGRADSVVIHDFVQRRISMYDPRFTRYVRSVGGLPRIHDMLALPDGRLLLSGNLAEDKKGGASLQLMRPDGTRSPIAFSAEGPSLHPERTQARWLLRLSNGEVLTARTDRYELQRWSTDWRPIRQYRREVSWFPPLDPSVRIDWAGRTPYPAQVYGVGENAEDRTVLVNSIVGATNFVRDPEVPLGTGEVKIPASANENPQLYLSRYLDTVIDFLDIERSVVLKSVRLPGVYGMISRSAFHWRLRERKDGSLSLEIVKFELRR